MGDSKASKDKNERDVFITNLTINKVRHLKDIHLPLSNEKRKHLILTGKNGSGKTSVLESLKAKLLWLNPQFRVKKGRQLNYYRIQFSWKVRKIFLRRPFYTWFLWGKASTGYDCSQRFGKNRFTKTIQYY